VRAKQGIKAGKTMHMQNAVEESRPDCAPGEFISTATSRPAHVHSGELLASRPASSGRNAQTGGGAAPAADPAASRIAKLEQQCSRLAHELSSVACDADRRDREYQAQIEALVRRLHECESELSERDGRLVAVTHAHETLRSQVESGDVATTAAAAVYRRELRRNAEVARSLKARFEERGRALDIAGEQIAALHAERASLLDTLEARTRQVTELLTQLARGEIRDGFGMDFQGDLGRVLLEDPAFAAAPGAAACWHSAGVNEQTIVLGAAPSEESAAEGATGGGVCAAAVAARGPRLRRYLLPVDAEVDQPFELTGPRSYVGRGIEADVCLTHPTISRLHGVLYRVGGSTIVEDARSSNGVFVNRERVQQAVLKDGDIVSFGNVAFWFRVTIADF
jgi:hypothetical protein